MTNAVLYPKMLKLKDLMNGDESKKFKEFYYGRFFTGDITITDSGETCTLSFHTGDCISVVEGIPLTGVDVGVSGGAVEWEKFCTHKSLSIATNRGNEHNLVLMGGPIRFRQNFNVVAQLIRVYSGIR